MIIKGRSKASCWMCKWPKHTCTARYNPAGKRQHTLPATFTQTCTMKCTSSVGMLHAHVCRLLLENSCQCYHVSCVSGIHCGVCCLWIGLKLYLTPADKKQIIFGFGAGPISSNILQLKADCMVFLKEYLESTNVNISEAERGVSCKLCIRVQCTGTGDISGSICLYIW